MNPILQLLLLLTLTTSATVLLVALVRRPLARAFDVRAAYLAWLSVPAAMLAALLPSPRAASPVVATQLLDAMPTTAALTLKPAIALQAGLPWDGMALGIWGAGAAAMAAALWVQQRQFARRLLQSPTGWELPAGMSACVVGAWQPRLALPADFEHRFSAEERELILAHEAVHLARRDNLWNLLAAACCCLQWFNPLAWWGWRRMRADQELACDAAVLIDRQPTATLTRYAEALVRSHQQAAQALLPTLASPWRPQSGLVERVAHLRAHVRRRGARRHDRAWVAGLVLAAAGTVSATTAMQVRDAVVSLEAGQGPAVAADAVDATAPTVLRWRLQAREDGRALDAHVDSLTLMHGLSPAGVTARHVHSEGSSPRWCFEAAGQRFRDGSWRTTGRLLDPTCTTLLTEPQPLAADGSLQTFTGRLANGSSLEVDITARRFAMPANTVWLDVGLTHNLPVVASAGVRLLGPMGQPMRLEAGPRPPEGADALAVELTTTEGGGNLARIQTRLLLGKPARVLAEPLVITRWGEPARLLWEDPATGQRVEVRVTPHRSAAAPV